MLRVSWRGFPAFSLFGGLGRRHRPRLSFICQLIFGAPTPGHPASTEADKATISLERAL